MTETFTAFEGLRRFASGPLTDIAPAIKHAEARASEPIAIFSDATGRRSISTCAAASTTC